ncbi:MAG: transketolase [Clostridia bacterium]|jgi:transketolase|nr:transketolase [Clostridia bacterium]
MEQTKLNELKQIAAKIRLGVLEGVHAAASGHPGGSLSIADIMAYLYFEELNVRADEPNWADRDRFVLSKGHTAPALYAALALKGFFPESELSKLRHVDSFLQGHPDMKGTPGVDMSTGSLGLGFSTACGMALAAKIDGKDYRTYTIVGDGESEEGQIWEAAMFASHYKLDNLCLIVDWNGLQIDGTVEEVMNPTPHDKKLEAFGFHVISIDGHDLEQIAAAFAEAKTVKGKPTAIIAKTIKGKGVSFMEDQVGWHGSAPNDEQYEKAVAEIKAAM